jgi:hypothetical protein
MFDSSKSHNKHRPILLYQFIRTHLLGQRCLWVTRTRVDELMDPERSVVNWEGWWG